jgi:uncharacterized membrane protein YfcA
VDLPPLGDIAVVVAGALAAGFVNGLTGTGYALVALGIWLHAMSPATAAPLAALCAVGGHVQSLPRIWRGVIWPRLWPFLMAGLVGVPVGTALLQRVAVQPLKLGVGLLLVSYCAWIAFVRRPPIVTGGGAVGDAAIGFTGGVLGGLASMSGPAPAVWAQLRGWTMHEQRGVNQPYNMMILIVVVVTAAVAGLLDRAWLVWAAIALPSTVVGTRLGLLLYGRLDDRSFNRIVLTLLGLSGAMLIVSSLA